MWTLPALRCLGRAYTRCWWWASCSPTPSRCCTRSASFPSVRWGVMRVRAHANHSTYTVCARTRARTGGCAAGECEWRRAAPLVAGPSAPVSWLVPEPAGDVKHKLSEGALPGPRHRSAVPKKCVGGGAGGIMVGWLGLGVGRQGGNCSTDKYVTAPAGVRCLRVPCPAALYHQCL
jgi:hypothetical protein